jgi:hypothetical protein
MKSPTYALLAATLIGSTAFADDGKAVDKSGTNPTLLLRSAGLSNEYSALSSGGYLDTMSLKFTQPFDDGKMSLRLNVPHLWTDRGPDRSGFGDLSLKWTWVAKVTKQDGWVASAEVAAPTGSSAFTSDQWIAAPGITYVRFLGPELILAPAYVHRFSAANEATRADTNAGTVDLYVVYRPTGKSWWLTGDFAVGVDYEDSGKTPMSFALQCGFKLGKLGDSVVNGFIRPSIGIGDDRANDWSAEAGISVIGF